MKLSLFFLIALGATINCSAMDTVKVQPTAPGNIAIDAGELARLQLAAARYHASIEVESERQANRHYQRPQSTERLSGHHRQRSLSETSLEERIPEDSLVLPRYSIFETQIKDGSLQLGLYTLEQMKAIFEKLCSTTATALKERAEVHQKISAGQLTPELPRATGVDRFRSKEARTKRSLDAQVRKNTKLREDSGRAFNHLLAAVIAANSSLAKLQEAVSHGAEKATEQHQKIERKTLAQGMRTRTISDPSVSYAREYSFSPTDCQEV